MQLYMEKRFYVTTPIYYVNDKPHIGHAYTTIVADVFARFYRQKLGDKNVFFLTGTDEHGAKIAQAAEKNGKTPQEFVDEVSEQYQKVWSRLGVSNDYFFRTTNEEHKKIVQELLQKLRDKEYIYKANYTGTYCVGCEKYLTSDEIIGGKCPHHPTTALEEKEEENYFFKLSHFAPKVKELIVGGEFKVLPEERKTEILSKIDQGINDISISRTGVDWGIPVPWDKEHTIYVWVDALFNYYSVTKMLKDKEVFWPANLHLMAKDILWFHTLIWEALLLALEEEIPQAVFAHGFFTIEGQKMSKSIGNIIDPLDLADEYTVDGLRYLLLSSFSFGNDGDFAVSKFTEKFNADLANGIGNLVSRVSKLCEKSEHDYTKYYNSIQLEIDDEVNTAMESYRPDEALRVVIAKVQRLDADIQVDKPWTQEGDSLVAMLEKYITRIVDVAYNLQPFLPETSEKILAVFSAGNIVKPEPLFNRM
jgi:methionyl-tRNA synthetase